MKNMKSFQDRNYSTSSIKRSAKDKYVARSLFSSGFTTIAATTGNIYFGSPVIGSVTRYFLHTRNAFLAPYSSGS